MKKAVQRRRTQVTNCEDHVSSQDQNFNQKNSHGLVLYITIGDCIFLIAFVVWPYTCQPKFTFMILKFQPERIRFRSVFRPNNNKQTLTAHKVTNKLLRKEQPVVYCTRRPSQNRISTIYKSQYQLQGSWFRDYNTRDSSQDQVKEVQSKCQVSSHASIAICYSLTLTQSSLGSHRRRRVDSLVSVY